MKFRTKNVGSRYGKRSQKVTQFYELFLTVRTFLGAYSKPYSPSLISPGGERKWGKRGGEGKREKKRSSKPPPCLAPTHKILDPPLVACAIIERQDWTCYRQRAWSVRLRLLDHGPPAVLRPYRPLVLSPIPLPLTWLVSRLPVKESPTNWISTSSTWYFPFDLLLTFKLGFTRLWRLPVTESPADWL